MEPWTFTGYPKLDFNVNIFLSSLGLYRCRLVWFLVLYSPHYRGQGSEVKFQMSPPRVSVSSEFLSPATLVVTSPALAERRPKEEKNFYVKVQFWTPCRGSRVNFFYLFYNYVFYIAYILNRFLFYISLFEPGVCNFLR